VRRGNGTGKGRRKIKGKEIGGKEVEKQRWKKETKKGGGRDREKEKTGWGGGNTK
jgi:hypothetical protein